MGKYCTNCGTQLSPNAKFCPSCGIEVYRSPDKVQTHTPTPPPATAKKRKSSHAKLIISVVAVVLAIALLVTIALHKWKHETLLSVAGGTLCYVLLVQLVF